MTEEDKETLLSIIFEVIGKSVSCNEESLVYHDLKISGDDAFELLNNIHKKFGTNFSEFDFEKFFPNETEDMYYQVMPFLKKRKTKLKIKDLMSAIENGAWVTPTSQHPEKASK